MARRRRFLERPHKHLEQATAAHARIVGEPATAEALAEGEQALAELEAKRKPARQQKRDQGGKFA